jgi:RHS repeat-associated protein
MSRRVAKTVGSTTNKFLYDDWAMIQESTGTQTNSYVYGLDLSSSMQGAGGIGGLLSASLNGTQAFYFYDANGNVSDLAATNGTSLAHYEWDPYGNATVSSGSLASVNPFRFSTKYTDEETELLYYGFRYYSPMLGRWVSRDPLGEGGGLHTYVFVSNAPLNSYDKYGLWTETVHNGMTRTWATVLLISADTAETIGVNDNLVDVTYDPTIIDDAHWSWHFNRSPFLGEDSRIIHKNEMLAKAKERCANAKDQPALAAAALGMALHPLQDAVAHGDYNRNRIWEAPSLNLAALTGWHEEAYYWHNYGQNPVGTLIGYFLGVGSGSDPDNPNLDAVGGDAYGVATMETALSTSSLRFKVLSNGDFVYYTPYSSGSKRIRRTQNLTEEFLSEFQDYVLTQHSACKCRNAFLGI